MSGRASNKLTPVTGFNVVKVIEDMDCLTPVPDHHKVVGSAGSLQEAKEIARHWHHPFGMAYIVDSEGNKLDWKQIK